MRKIINLNQIIIILKEALVKLDLLSNLDEDMGKVNELKDI